MSFIPQLLIIASAFIAAQANNSAPPLADVLRHSLEALNQRDLEHEDDDSVECMAQTMMIYKALDGEDPHQDFEGISNDLPPLFPFLSIDESMIDEEFCRTVHRDDSDSPIPLVLCNLKKVLFDISHQCLDVGGRPVPLNANIKCDEIEGPDIKMKNIPFCAGRSCDEKWIHLMNDMMNNAGLHCSIALTVAHDTMKCLEVSDNRFTIGSTGKMRTCKWLQQKPLKARMRLCGASQDIRDACGQTCCQCSSTNERKLNFFKSFRDGAVTNKCAWLARKSEEVKQRLCSIENATGHGDVFKGYDPAWKQCPSTCGRCPAFD